MSNLGLDLATLEDIRRVKRDKAKDVTEDAIERHLGRQCEPHGALVLKMRTDYRGFVDRLVLWGYINTNCGLVPWVDFVELKRPKGGAFEPLQARWHAKISSMGYGMFVLRDKQAVDEYVQMRVKALPPGVRRPKGLTLALHGVVKHPRKAHVKAL